MSQEITRLRDLSKSQVRSGLAAWLGWLFDGLDMHLYTLVATPFVAQLLGLSESDPAVGRHGSIIQAAFLVGWALGGGFFGRVGDLLGRSRALSLTILTYACFTGLSFFAQTWWQLMIFRFLAALGIGGEWAVGASLLSETWPKNWRPWIAAMLQSAVNIGVLLACLAGSLLAGQDPHYIFLVGILPALHHAVDSQGGAGTGGLGEGARRPGRAAHQRAVRPRGAQHDVARADHLRRVADGALGVPVLAAEACAESAGDRRADDEGGERQRRRRRADVDHGRLVDRQFSRRRAGEMAGLPPDDLLGAAGLLRCHVARLPSSLELGDDEEFSGS